MPRSVPGGGSRYFSVTSQPGYGREQIVGLLVGAQNLGAVAGVACKAPAQSSNGNVR